MKTKQQERVLLVYIPSLHQGYINLIEEVKPEKIILLNPDSTFDALIEKDASRKYLKRSFLYALTPEIICSLLKSLYGESISIGVGTSISGIMHSAEAYNYHFVLPQEDISEYIVSDFFKPENVSYEFTNSHFLRWSKGITSLEQTPDNKTASDDQTIFIKDIVRKAYQESEKSQDVWRQVGAVLFNPSTKEIVSFGYNNHLPGGNHQYTFGDARASFKAGEHPDLVTAIHAEQSVLMKALRAGVSTERLSLYSTTYPCPVCAKLISQSGIKKMYYTEGYSVMEQAGNVMKAFGVEVIHVPKEVFEKAHR